MGHQCGKFVGGLHIRLVEARESFMSVSSLMLRVKILFVIFFILEVVNSLAISNVIGNKPNDYCVLTLFQIFLWEIHSVVSKSFGVFVRN